MKFTNKLGVLAKDLLPGALVDYFIKMKEKSGFKEKNH